MVEQRSNRFFNLQLKIGDIFMNAKDKNITFLSYELGILDLTFFDNNNNIFERFEQRITR